MFFSLLFLAAGGYSVSVSEHVLLGESREKRDLLNLLGWCKAEVDQPAVHAFEPDIPLQPAPKEDTRSELDTHHALCPYKYLFLGMLLQAKLSDLRGKEESGIRKFFKKKVPPKIAIVSDNTTEVAILLGDELPVLGDELNKILVSTTLIAGEGLNTVVSTLPKNLKILSVGPENSQEHGTSEENALFTFGNVSLTGSPSPNAVMSTPASTALPSSKYVDMHAKDESSGIRRFFKVGCSMMKSSTSPSLLNHITTDNVVYLPEDLPVPDDFYDSINTTYLVATVKPNISVKGLFSHWMNFSRPHWHNDSLVKTINPHGEIHPVSPTHLRHQELPQIPESSIGFNFTLEYNPFLNENYLKNNGSVTDTTRNIYDDSVPFSTIPFVDETSKIKEYKNALPTTGYLPALGFTEIRLSDLPTFMVHINQSNFQVSQRPEDNFSALNSILNEYVIHDYNNDQIIKYPQTDKIEGNIQSSSVSNPDYQETPVPIVFEIPSYNDQKNHIDIGSPSVTNHTGHYTNLMDIETKYSFDHEMIQDNATKEITLKLNLSEINEENATQYPSKANNTFLLNLKKINKSPIATNISNDSKLVLQVPKTSYPSVLRYVLELIGLSDKTSCPLQEKHHIGPSLTTESSLSRITSSILIPIIDRKIVNPENENSTLHNLIGHRVLLPLASTPILPIRNEFVGNRHYDVNPESEYQRKYFPTYNGMMSVNGTNPVIPASIRHNKGYSNHRGDINVHSDNAHKLERLITVQGLTAEDMPSRKLYNLNNVVPMILEIPTRKEFLSRDISANIVGQEPIMSEVYCAHSTIRSEQQETEKLYIERLKKKGIRKKVKKPSSNFLARPMLSQKHDDVFNATIDPRAERIKNWKSISKDLDSKETSRGRNEILQVTSQSSFNSRQNKETQIRKESPASEVRRSSFPKRDKRTVQESYVDFNLRYCLFPMNKTSYEDALAKSMSAIREVQRSETRISPLQNKLLYFRVKRWAPTTVEKKTESEAKLKEETLKKEVKWNCSIKSK